MRRRKADLLPSVLQKMSTGEMLIVWATYQNSSFKLVISDSENTLDEGEFSVADLGLYVSIESSEFIDQFGVDKLQITEGALTITKRSNVWILGSLESVLPDDSIFTIDYKVELP